MREGHERRGAGRSKVRLVASVVLAGVVCGVVSLWGGFGVAQSDGVARSRPQVTAAQVVQFRRAAARRRARRRWLASPAARAQRVASQMAFHGLSGAAAERLLMRDYGSSLQAASVNPAASLARSGRVLRYLSNSRAVVATPRGVRLVTSSVPLRVAGSGGAGPVNLDLTQSAQFFAPSRPLVGVRIARDSGGGVLIGSEGVGLNLVGRSVQGVLSSENTAFFAGVGRDLDAAAVPKLHGADILAVLRSRLSPHILRYRVNLPKGAVLREASDGATVSRGGAVLARIPYPSAHDAQGSSVPVGMRVVGDELVVEVDATTNVAYPAFVDPEVWVQNLAESPEEDWAYTNETSEGTPEEHTFPAGGPISISSAATLSGHAHETWSGEGGGTYTWTPPAGLEELSSVEFLDVSAKVSESASYSKYSPKAEARASIEACTLTYGDADLALGENIEVTELSSTLRIANPKKETAHCDVNKIYIHAHMAAWEGYLPEEGPPEEDWNEPQSAKLSTSLSVGAVLLYQEMTSQELLALEAEYFGLSNPGDPNDQWCMIGEPVNCATGNEVESQTDLSVGGRGLGLQLDRTYNSRQAVHSTSPGMFGNGWASSYSAHIALESRCDDWTEKKPLQCIPLATVYQDNGSAVRFEEFHEQWDPTASLVQATLAKEGTGYVYTLPDQTKLHFNSSGVLTSEAERNGNALTMTYSGGRLESVSDSAGRKLTFAYNSEGRVTSAKDPLGHTVKYTYEKGELATVTQPGETKLRWKFKYGTLAQLTSETDGREHTTTIEYNSSHQVASETDPLSRKRTFEYTTIAGGTQTTITEPNTSVTVEKFNARNEPTSVTHASGTAIAATTTYEHNPTGELTAVTDPNKHTTEYGYDASGDRTSEKDADGDQTKWTYDSTHDIETATTPDGETTTIKRNSDGDPTTIERPAPGEKTQKTTYKYDSHGDVESVTDALERTWQYEYDTYGDRKAETDPEGNKRTWEYNEDSQEIATVSPRGNVKGAEASKYTTKIERNDRDQPLTITAPLSHKTTFTYDGNGNLETLTDPNSHKSKYTYDADNERTKAEEADGNVTETGYDAAGQVTSQTDGNKHTTKYVRNLLEETTEVIDPKERKTYKEYDAAGNLTSLQDAAGRTTTYIYDPANRLKEVSYSDGKTHAVAYEYNKDGAVTTMTDGSGTTKYTYDELERLTEAESGHKEIIKYEYDLASEQIKITYPNGKAVTRSYDKDGRLEKVIDWLEHSTKFSYDPDSDLTASIFPTETKDEDKYIYNEGDQPTEAKFMFGSETLASLAYTRDSDNQVKTITSKGLPGEEKPAFEYDSSNRLTKGAGVAYEYDAANNPTKIGTSTYKYDSADELESSTSAKYAYNEVGERVKTTPTTGPATTYGYDQAGNLTSVERPKEGEVAKIEDSYGFNGVGLRVSQTISGTTKYLAWDTTEPLPLVLSDETNSYIYGPGEIPIEQISSGGTATYLHHDQQGSTRLLTGSTGAVTGKCSYGPYGAPTCEGTTTTPLGYDGQYTSSDTGLIYMRARVYDPSTAQFLSVDPFAAVTVAPYNYAADNPVNNVDPSGLSSTAEGLGEGGVPCVWPLCGPPPAAQEAIEHGIRSMWNRITEAEGPNDEGEGELKTKEAEREPCGNPAAPPGSKFKWMGKGEPGSEEGSWYDEETDEYLRPDFKPSSHGPHYDYRGADGKDYRIYPDGRLEPKIME